MSVDFNVFVSNNEFPFFTLIFSQRFGMQFIVYSSFALKHFTLERDRKELLPSAVQITIGNLAGHWRKGGSKTAIYAVRRTTIFSSNAKGRALSIKGTKY